MYGDMRRDGEACVGRTQTAANAWPPDEGRSLLDHLALRGCIFFYVLRVAWSFAHLGELHIHSSRVSGQLIHSDCFSFP
jgi:hypothetical protein